MFPRCTSPIKRTQRGEFIAAVDANEVAASDLGCEFLRNSPLIAKRNVSWNNHVTLGFRSRVSKLLPNASSEPMNILLVHTWLS